MSGKITKHIINLDADPFVRNGFEVEKHIKGGQLEFEPNKIKLYSSKLQKDDGVACGYDLREELQGKAVLNANVLFYLLEHPEIIPEDWKGKHIFFWGTTYIDPFYHTCVYYLYWVGDNWWSEGDYLVDAKKRFGGNDVAALIVS